VAEKTEHPTPRRLRQARDKGDVAVSSALAQGLSFVAVLSLLPSLVQALFSTTVTLLRGAVAGASPGSSELATLVVELSVPVLIAGAVCASATAFVQGGGLWAPARIAPDFARLSPVSGLASLFSLPRVFGVARSLTAALAVGAIGYAVLLAALPGLVFSSGELLRASHVAARASQNLGYYAAIVGLLLGTIDWGVTRRAWQKRWMMSRDEVRREAREGEGDPELKAARRRAHQEVLSNLAIHAVKDASVLIVNPTHLATALRYREDSDTAPLVLAHGEGDLARRMIEAAAIYGVPVVRDVPIAHALKEIETGEEIPEALYEAVAEILREVWSLEQK
jgi:flagellar biosynthesis protein FlhB